MDVIFKLKNKGIVEINLVNNKLIINETYLTIGQGFDIMLIKTLDKILNENKMDRLSLKSVQISGKIDHHALSSMMLRATVAALNM